MEELALGAARALSGLLAGVYVAFLVAVMPALRRQPDEVFVRVMTAINEVIVNPAFLLLFLGAPILTGALLGWHRSPLVIVALVLAMGALVVTFAASIPLNNALADGAGRASYENPWLVWHSVRTAAAVGSFVLLSLPGSPGRP